MKLIKRDYLKELIGVKDTPDIKIITGIRRCGKSKLLDMFYEYLSNIKSTNIVRIKLNLQQFKELRDAGLLYDYVSKLYKPNRDNYLLIDEIQMCSGFEPVITSLHDEEKYKIFLTGSNAFLLSSDLATLFGGRTYELSLFPFSFAEYMEYFESNDIDEAFNCYFKIGGMSGAYLYKGIKEQYKYVSGIYKTTIIKDIIDKYKIEDKILLKMIVDYLMDNIGSEISYRNIANALTSKSFKTNHKIVGRYLEYLCNSFMFYPIIKFDIRGKKYLESNKKYYIADISFRFATIGTKNEDIGHLYENIVAIELLRRGYEVYAGAVYDKQIDFIAIKDGTKQYIQVSYDLSKPSTKSRELDPLLKIKDGYEKIIISRTKTRATNIEGVKIIDIARWLLNQPDKM